MCMQVYGANMDAHDLKLPPPSAAPGAHEIRPLPDSVYSTGGPNTGLRASLMNPGHYPVEAICAGDDDVPCGRVICSLSYSDTWRHTSRMPGDPR